MKKVFYEEDLVLSKLRLPDKCPVKIEIIDGYIYLYVGQRDFQWDIETGELIGTGTGI